MDIFGLIEVPFLIFILTLVVVWLFRLGYSGFDHFDKRGIPTVQPVRPFVGNIWGYWKRDNRSWQLENVKKYGRVFGAFDGKNPHLYVSDPDLIKSILVKDFANFTDHRLFSDGFLGWDIVRKFLFVMKGEEWKESRNAVTPAFSSGKIKKMSRIMEQCCDRMVNDVRKVARDSGEVEAKTLFGSLTLDVIARCAFGTNIENLNDPGNPFIYHSYNAFRPPLFNSALSIIPELFPWIAVLGFDTLINRKSIDFFVDLVREIIRKRRAEDSSDAKRGDFLDVLLEEMDAEEEKRRADPSVKQVMTEEVLISQCVTFFAAGFDTVGTAMAAAAHHLALNPDCQEKLYEEVKSKKEEHKGLLNHETIQECQYLDQVFSETLRITPPEFIIDRGCVKSCEIGGIKFEKGDQVVLPMYAIHHLEEHFPDPEKFDPDRFSPENRAKIKPYTYFPFGHGPRICIGMRFAHEEAKLALANLVLNFRLYRCPKTNDPIKMAGNRFVNMPYDMYLRIEER